MSITPQVREALDRQGIHETSVNRDGYRVEEGPDDSAVVRWGRGEPFRGYRPAVKGRISHAVVAPSTAQGSTSYRKSLKTRMASTSW